MALKAILDNTDGLAEDIAKEYKQRDDGKFVLDVTSVDGLELAEVSKLQSALSKERESNRKSAELLKKFDDLDPAKAREALKKVDEMANWEPEQKVKEQIEAVKASIIEAHGKEKAILEEKQSKLTKSLEEAMIVSVASQVLAEQGCTAPKGPMLYIRQQTRMIESGDKQVVQVLGDDETPRLTGTDGHSMSINELVTEMKAQNDFSYAFEGSGATGSGAHGDTQTTNGRSSYEELAKLPPAERMKQAEKMGINK